MAEYIKRYDAMKICQGYSQHCFETNDSNGQDIADRIEDDIVAIPTADVVEVVRCKDCKHYSGGRFCFHFTDTVFDDDFCSYGERRDI